MNQFIKICATFFYVGYFPVAPGTMATFAGTLVALAVRGHIGLYIGLTVLFTILGFIVSDRMEAIAGQKDPSCVVIDEVAGVMIALFLLPVSVPIWITAFFLFRAFDMFKIYPANRMEQIKGGVGVMMDDVVAGLYTNVIMHVVLFIIAR